MDLHSVTSSPDSADGAWLSELLGSGTTSASGLPVARASLSARQAREQGLLMSGTSGRSSNTSPASAALQESLVSRLQAATQSLGSTLYKMTWKPWAMPSGRSRFRLRASVLRTSETARTGWPTPIANEAKAGLHCANQVTVSMAAQLAGWVTPTTRDWKDSGADIRPRADGSERFDQLPRQANLAGWPTPMAGTPAQNGNNAAGDNDSSRKTVDLCGWPTPVANDSTGSTHCYSGTAPDGSRGLAWKLSGAARLLGSGEILTGSAAGMMGLPPGWDEAAPIGMPPPVKKAKATAPGVSPDTATRSTSKRRASSSNVPSELSDLL